MTFARLCRILLDVLSMTPRSYGRDCCVGCGGRTSQDCGLRAAVALRDIFHLPVGEQQGGRHTGMFNALLSLSLIAATRI